MFVDRRAHLFTYTPPSQPARGVTIPADDWKVSAPEYEYRVPYRTEGPCTVARDVPLRELLARMVGPLIHSMMKYHRTYVTRLSDEPDCNLFRWLAMEVLLRTQSELRGLPLAMAVRRSAWSSARLGSVLQEVFGAHPAPAHDFFFRFHGCISDRDTIEYVRPMCDAYNAAIGAIVCPPPRATLDEVVLRHPHATYPSRKHNAFGPEFLLLSGPVVGTDENIHYHIRGRDWGANQGPNMR